MVINGLRVFQESFPELEKSVSMSPATQALPGNALQALQGFDEEAGKALHGMHGSFRKRSAALQGVHGFRREARGLLQDMRKGAAERTGPVQA